MKPMRTELDCLVCLYRQALNTARLATNSTEVQRRILTETAALLPRLDPSLSPPENSIRLYRLIARLSDNPDPYAELKKTGNEHAMRLRDRVQKSISAAHDPLYTAILFAIAGNIIDHGAPQDFDLDQTINKCLHRTPAINDYERLTEDLKGAENILYLGDNCGELVFDGLLIELLPGEVTLALKEKPIINDALPADARLCGLDKICRIISNGTDCPGTPLNLCGKEFKAAMAKADLIISKGQGNFETLSHLKDGPPLYFLLTTKCPIVAQRARETAGAAAKIVSGDTLLMRAGF